MNGVDQEGHRPQEKPLEITELQEGLRGKWGLSCTLKDELMIREKGENIQRNEAQ